ncbi:ribosome assembly cofactor RimP [Mucilaginibacter sp. Bleaf8]|uniref:ribosome assembly cofactor RimP n=1 Tax=Mucilaginibacter sp. Bleaf8 TaxID=2834430 RepID=UPI001BCB1690|nr:ribosome assembly cofactor RimP [Mucilaginibacter sp. Bleaf8]MBS7565851.1 ribosome assembly cofactor RimP [Mucilaginibacter sp. Bleaf8]
MTNVEKRVTELVEQKLTEKPNVFLVSVKMHSQGRLVILIDGDNGLDVGDCAEVSRFVGHYLEEENVLTDAYTLEVSSPGIDAPLTLPRQFLKNIGRQVSIKLTDGSKREGKLLALTANHVQIEEKIKPKGKKAELIESNIPSEDIVETKVLISFK